MQRFFLLAVGLRKLTIVIIPTYCMLLRNARRSHRLKEASYLLVHPLWLHFNLEQVAVWVSSAEQLLFVQ